jgi:hypothetical protein
MYLTIRAGTGNKYIYDILYIVFNTTTTCWGKYYPSGIDLYLVICRSRDILYEKTLIENKEIEICNCCNNIISISEHYEFNFNNLYKDKTIHKFVMSLSEIKKEINL